MQSMFRFDGSAQAPLKSHFICTCQCQINLFLPNIVTHLYFKIYYSITPNHYCTRQRQRRRQQQQHQHEEHQHQFLQLIGGVQASRAYHFPAALQLPVCGRPCATPAVCLPDRSLYRDGHAETTHWLSVCSRPQRPVCNRLARPVCSIWYSRPRHLVSSRSPSVSVVLCETGSSTTSWARWSMCARLGSVNTKDHVV